MTNDLRARFIRELTNAPSLDENGYICTKHEAIEAFDRAVSVASPNIWVDGGHDDERWQD